MNRSTAMLAAASVVMILALSAVVVVPMGDSDDSDGVTLWTKKIQSVQTVPDGDTFSFNTMTLYKFSNGGMIDVKSGGTLNLASTINMSGTGGVVIKLEPGSRVTFASYTVLEPDTTVDVVLNGSLVADLDLKIKGLASLITDHPAVGLDSSLKLALSTNGVLEAGSARIIGSEGTELNASVSFTVSDTFIKILRNEEMSDSLAKLLSEILEEVQVNGITADVVASILQLGGDSEFEAIVEKLLLGSDSATATVSANMKEFAFGDLSTGVLKGSAALGIIPDKAGKKISSSIVLNTCDIVVDSVPAATGLKADCEYEVSLGFEDGVLRPHVKVGDGSSISFDTLDVDLLGIMAEGSDSSVSFTAGADAAIGIDLADLHVRGGSGEARFYIDADGFSKDLSLSKFLGVLASFTGGTDDVVRAMEEAFGEKAEVVVEDDQTVVSVPGLRVAVGSRYVPIEFTQGGLMYRTTSEKAASVVGIEEGVKSVGFPLEVGYKGRMYVVTDIAPDALGGRIPVESDGSTPVDLPEGVIGFKFQVLPDRLVMMDGGVLRFSMSECTMVPGERTAVYLSLDSGEAFSGASFRLVLVDTPLRIVQVTASDGFSCKWQYTESNVATITVTPIKDVSVPCVIAKVVFLSSGQLDGTIGYRVEPTVNDSQGYLMNARPFTGVVKVADRLTGDIDGDGEVNANDSLLIKRYIAGWDVDADPAQMDLDGNGFVDLRDSLLLTKYLAGWDVKFAYLKS